MPILALLPRLLAACIAAVTIRAPRPAVAMMPPEGLFRGETCGNDPVNNSDPLGLDIHSSSSGRLIGSVPALTNSMRYDPQFNTRSVWNEQAHSVEGNGLDAQNRRALPFP
jgi:hypothetical protein